MQVKQVTWPRVIGQPCARVLEKEQEEELAGQIVEPQSARRAIRQPRGEPLRGAPLRKPEAGLDRGPRGGIERRARALELRRGHAYVDVARVAGWRLDLDRLLITARLEMAREPQGDLGLAGA